MMKMIILGIIKNIYLIFKRKNNIIKMKIVITGALGHIGSKLIRALPNSFKKLEIILIDNMITQRYPSLFNLPKNCTFRFIEKDIKNIDLNKLFKGVNFVIHLAAITDATWSVQNPQIVEKNNYQCTKKIAEACAINKSVLVAFSSTSVYGTQSNKIDENCNINELNPQSPYAKTKLKEEKLLTKMKKKLDLKFTIFRFGTIYGTSNGMRFHTAVNKFCWQASLNQPITIWKTAYNQKRPYLNLNDAINSIIFAIKNNFCDGDIYNILTKNHTVKEIVENIKKYIPKIKIKFVNSKIMNQLSYEVIDDKIRKKGFKYIGNLDEGIKETIFLFDNIKNN